MKMVTYKDWGSHPLRIFGKSWDFNVYLGTKSQPLPAFSKNLKWQDALYELNFFSRIENMLD